MGKERSASRWIRPALASSLLLTFSCVVAVGLCEIALRFVTAEPADLYSGLTFAPDLNSLNRELAFVQRYTAKPTAAMASDIRYDPYLGWDANAGDDRIRGNTSYSPTPGNGMRRIITIGDSFTYGAEVGDNETYSSYLEELLDGVEVLNMGAGGFGIDQAVLKYLKYGSVLKPDLLVFGIHPPNWERCTLSFNAYSKPRFVYDYKSGGVTLTNTDHLPPEEAISGLRENTPHCYLIPFLRQRFLQFRWRTDFGSQERYWFESTMVVKHVFEQLLASLQQDETPLLIVQIPLGGHFASEDLLRAGQDANMQIMYLRGLYDAFNISCIDLIVELPRRYSREQVLSEFYTRHPNGQPGHLTPAGNRVVAELIRDRLKEPLKKYKTNVELEWDKSVWEE